MTTNAKSRAILMTTNARITTNARSRPQQVQANGLKAKAKAMARAINKGTHA